MNKVKVLFVCLHNSARSQMAEAFFNLISKGKMEAESAGIEPGALNPYAVEVMKDSGIDISGNKTKSVWDLFQQGRRYSYLVTVCDQAAAQKCPMFPGVIKTFHWDIPDPAALRGTREEQLEKSRDIRDTIRKKVVELIEEISHI
ncbi:MAG: arsenate reductase ArsC [Endomicrobiales bacterium]|nr:arsenate reductase ArsC [Endomicrobiales bacterium]